MCDAESYFMQIVHRWIKNISLKIHTDLKFAWNLATNADTISTQNFKPLYFAMQNFWAYKQYY